VALRLVGVLSHELEALAVETSARKSKREKRLFRLNVPTATCTGAPDGEDAEGTLLILPNEVKTPVLRP
jgi:hypothetical protein